MNMKRKCLKRVCLLVSMWGLMLLPALATTENAYFASHVRAENDSTYPSIAMRMSADYLVLYNPSTGDTKRILSPTTNTLCAINSYAVGYRDQAGSYSSNQTIWFYWIWGSTPGLNVINSARGPRFGPNLPQGYTDYCPAFPMVVSAWGQIQYPVFPGGGGGTTTVRVRGQKAFFVNTPDWVITTGEYTTNIDLTPLIPKGIDTALLYYDPECYSSSGALWAGFIPSAVSGNNYCNFSVYSHGASQVAAQNVSIETPLSDDNTLIVQWGRISGSNPTYTFDLFVQGYTFSY
jgi:hypothetical protein